MRNIFLTAALLITLIGCDQLPSEPQTLHAYFDMDSLLNAQITALTEQNVTLKKSVRKDGEEETKNFELDSAGWEKEFEILRDFNINLPRNVGAYNAVKNGETIVYKPTGKQDLPVQQFQLKYQNGQLASLSSEFIESKYIYSTDRNINLTFENGLLKKYQIKGTQNMIILGAVEYQILGSIINE